MNLTNHKSKRRVRGFSLLEMVVALLILALALGTLYRAASGATRNVRIDESYAYAVELASSLLADNGMVPVSGVNRTGETSSGFHWYVKTHAVELGPSPLAKNRLHEIEVGVAWAESQKPREVVLNSVVEGFDPASAVE